MLSMAIAAFFLNNLSNNHECIICCTLIRERAQWSTWKSGNSAVVDPTCEKHRKTSRTSLDNFFFLIWSIELRPHVLRGGGLGLLFQHSRLLLYFLFLFQEGKVYENAGKQTNRYVSIQSSGKSERAVHRKNRERDRCPFSFNDRSLTIVRPPSKVNSIYFSNCVISFSELQPSWKRSRLPKKDNFSRSRSVYFLKKRSRKIILDENPALIFE